MNQNIPEKSGKRRIVIIGVGNILLRDEGVGVHVAQELQKRAWPSDIQVLDGGLAGIGLLDFFAEASKVLLIDAADMNRSPGTLVRFTPEEVRSRAGDLRFSSHDVGLMEVLDLAKALGHGPADIVILGIQPKEISWGMDLTPEVQAAVSKAVDAVLAEVPLASSRAVC